MPRGVENVLHHGVGEKADFGIVVGAVQHDLGGAEIVAAVDQRHLAAETGEEIGLFHG